MPDSSKDVVYFAKLHWILFLWPGALAGVAIFLSFFMDLLREASFLLLMISLLWGLATWFTYHYSSLTIKKTQLILRTGFLVRQTVDIPLSKIESIDIRQTIPGSLFQYGSLVITGTGGTRQMIHYLEKPLTCRRYIEECMHG